MTIHQSTHGIQPSGTQPLEASTPCSDEKSDHAGTIPTPGLNRKRKHHDSVVIDSLFEAPIFVKPHPPKMHVQPHSLLPLMVLPREALPLSALDMNNDSGPLPSSRFYESNIKILDLESRLGSRKSLLIAAPSTSGSSYAIEKQNDGLFCILLLGKWVDLEVLSTSATAVFHSRLAPTRPQETKTPKYAAPLTTPQLNKEYRQKTAAIEAFQSFTRKRVRSASIIGLVTSSGSNLERSNKLIELQANAVSSTAEGDSPPTFINTDIVSGCREHAVASEPIIQYEPTECVLSNVRAQYFEALYKSKGSLAYFAKGPLSRARSAFRTDASSGSLTELVDFLKDLILNTVQIDKKYRETMPTILSKTFDCNESSGDNRKRKGRSKKIRLRKDCLYPGEMARIRSWWNTLDAECINDVQDDASQHLKIQCSLLRTRETQLQMILILEILALEAVRQNANPREQGAPITSAGGGANSSEVSMAPPPKKRGKHNFLLLIDVHADRLTIWQSTSSDDQTASGVSQSVSQKLTDIQSQKNVQNEPLRDFCIDVIVPFFAARLPELCDSVNRKLGGPVIASPKKSKRVKRSSQNSSQKSEIENKKIGSSKEAPRTLQRALSTDLHHRRSVSRGPNSMIALMRSASSTSMTTIKREGSEPVSIKREAEEENRKPLGLSRANSLSGAEELKARKRAKVEAELKDAISVLRKPNREVIGRAVTDAATQRGITAVPSKKNRKPGRMPLNMAVQVQATPANNRYKNMLSDRPTLLVSPAPLSTPVEEATLPPNFGGSIPSTKQRMGYFDILVPSTSPAADGLAVTPVRPSLASSFLRRTSEFDEAIPMSSPIASREEPRLLLSTNATTPFGRSPYCGKMMQTLFATPVKGSASIMKPDDGVEDRVEAPEGRQQTIYEKLGWDDDFDDL